MEVFIITQIYLKITFYTKVNQKLGLLSALLLGVLKNVVPFLMLFYFWNSFFGFINAKLGADYDVAYGYEMALFFGYFL